MGPKIYQYGVHIIALEVEGDMRMILDLSGEIGLQVAAVNRPLYDGRPPRHRGETSVEEFHIRRVSQARGPIVKELSGGVRHLVEEEANGPELVEKLNPAIRRKRDLLVFSTATG